MWSWALLKPPNILMATVSRLGPEDRWTAALGSKSSQPGNLQDLRPHGFFSGASNFVISYHATSFPQVLKEASSWALSGPPVTQTLFLLLAVTPSSISEPGLKRCLDCSLCRNIREKLLGMGVSCVRDSEAHSPLGY